MRNTILRFNPLWHNCAGDRIKRIGFVFVAVVSFYLLLIRWNDFETKPNKTLGLNQVLVATETTEDTRRDAPYKELCRSRPLGEKELWNMNKKVISFSLFPPKSQENVPEWMMGSVERNLQLAQRFYPDWVTRIYTFDMTDADIGRILAFTDMVEVVPCDPKGILGRGPNYRRCIARALAVDDPTVRYTLVRDVDSRFNVRELMAVNEFLASKLMFHAMWDHELHTTPVMGGIFGMKRGLFTRTDSIKNSTMSELVYEAYKDDPDRSPFNRDYGEDQEFYKKFVWPLVKNTALGHHGVDLKACRKYGAAVCRDFPMGDREPAFVGKDFKQKTHFFNCEMKCPTLNDEEDLGFIDF